MKKLTSVLAAGTLILAGFSGCTRSAEKQTAMQNSVKTGVAEKGAELTIMGGAHLVSVAEVVLRDFMQQHPDIKINFEKYSYSEYPTKMKIALSDGSPTPDILIIHDLFIRQFVDAGFLMDLSGITDRKNTLNVLSPVLTPQGIYGLPNQVTNQYVYMYRKDIYDSLGLKPPKTFDEYYDQALLLKKAGYYAGAWDPSVQPKCADLFLNFLYMLGGNVLDENGTVTLDKAEDTIKLIQKCYKAGIWHKSIQSDSDEYWTAFNSGVIAAFPGPAAHAAYYETSVDPNGKGGYGSIALVPSMKFSDSGPATYLNNTEYYAVNGKTKFPEAARMVVRYLAQSVEAAEKFSNVNEKGLMARYGTGYIPGLQAIANGTTSDGWKAFGGQKVVADLAADLVGKSDTICLPFVDQRSSEIKTIISEVLGEMFMKSKYSPAEAVAEIKKRISNI